MMRRLVQSTTIFLSDVVLRSIYKIAYKYSHPRSHRHNRRYWPHYQVERNPQGELSTIRFKNRLVVDNTRLECGSSNKCMLIATGPSVRKLEKAMFQHPDIDYVGVNGSISLDGVDFRYYVIIDYNFTRKRFDLVQKVLKTQCTLFTVPRCLDFILRKVPPSEIRCHVKVIELIYEGEIERFFGARVQVDDTRDYFYRRRSFGFSAHVFDAVFDYFTVTYVALQIAYALHYRKIYIAGLDMNDFSKPRFYENAENKQSTMLDHYSSFIFPAFDAAAEFLRKKNVQVYNLSPESAVESFEKMAPSLDCLSDLGAGGGDDPTAATGHLHDGDVPDSMRTAHAVQKHLFSRG